MNTTQSGSPFRSRSFYSGLTVLVSMLSVPISTMAAAGDEPEQAAWWVQTTYNGQRHGSMRSPYAGTNSLTAESDGMYTFSATLMGGLRLWPGAEAYLNVETDKGQPFTRSLIGMGSYTNGEITRAAGGKPVTYRQRLFLRQTWNQGGERVKLANEQNQLADLVDANRTVLTIGNFSTLDVFDDNRYAKDPRLQFMNWSHWTYAAYDYTADARGFGIGFALEVIRGDWSFKLGRLTGPKQPNELPLDMALGRHYGDQVEVERRYNLGGQPGAARLLAWRNRAVLARWDDALAAWRAQPSQDSQPLVTARQSEQIKWGVGINLEQALTADTGVFMRAMWADGHTETQSFTEVDRSLSLGTLLQGDRWQRASDSVGVAIGANLLSAARRRYLEAGGISYFIGDGGLNYRPEWNLEAFYNLGLLPGLSLTLDWQHIRNPAYNGDRGPLNVLALRLHAEY